MRRIRLLPLLLLLPLAAALGEPAAAPDEPERNTRRLEKWRADPAHYERLKRDLLAFKALPPEKQERLRQLDRELREHEHEREVLQRFAAWFDRLGEDDRRRVEAAGTRDE